MFKYWNYTTCIHSDNIAAIAQAVTQLLEQEEGCHRIPKPPQPVSDLEQLYRRPRDIALNLWIVGLFIGTSGWTIVKTWPNGLLCRRAKDASRPRLSALAIQLGCDVFHLEVHDSVEGFLLEADATGRTFLSGCPWTEAPNNFQFYEEQVDVTDLLKQFSLLQVPQAMQAAMKVNEDPEVLRREAEVERLMKENSDWSSLINQDEDFQGYTERIDRALASIVDGSKSYWYLNYLAYYAYAEPQRLEGNGAQLLYFHPPTTYNPSRS